MPEEAKPPYISEEVQSSLLFIFKILTQLRVGGMDMQIIGLDYNAVMKVADIYDFKLTPKRMDFIRIAERKIIDGQ